MGLTTPQRSMAVPIRVTISTLVGCGCRSRGASTRTDRPARLAHTIYAGVSAEGDGAPAMPLPSRPRQNYGYAVHPHGERLCGGVPTR